MKIAVAIARFMALMFLPGVAAAQTTPIPVTPRACDVTTVATGGTAVTALSGPANGFVLENPTTATEVLLYSLSGTAGSSQGNGTFGLAAGASLQFSAPLAAGTALSVNAATTGHAFACMRY